MTQGGACPPGRRWPLLVALLVGTLVLAGCSEVQLAINVVKKLHRETNKELPAESREVPSIEVPLPAGPKPVGDRGRRGTWSAVSGARLASTYRAVRSPLPLLRQEAGTGR